MALLEDQIEEAQAAFVAAHEAEDKEGAQILADHLRDLQAQKGALDKATLESSQSGTNLTNPLIAAGAGALAGAAVNPVINAVQDIAAPTKISTPHPSQITTPTTPWTPPKFTPQGMPVDPNVPRDVYHWMSGNPETGSTGQHAGVPVRGRNQLEAEKLAQEFHAKNAARAEFEAKNPGRSILDNGLEVSKADYEYVEGMKKKNQEAALLEHRIEQNAAKSAAAKQAKSAGKFNLLPSTPQPVTPFSIVKGGARGAITGAAASDIPQQLSQGNFGTAAADTGIGIGNIVHGLAKTPKGKALGSLLGIISGGTRAVQGINELTAPPVEQKAEGGLIHLAGGGTIANALTQTAINAPYVAPTAAGIVKNVGKGAYAPAMEDAASLGLAMAPLNPLTVGLSLMAPGEAGAGSTLDDLYKRRADEQAAIKRAKKQFEHEQFMQNKVGANAPKFLEDYQAKKMAKGGAVLNLLSDAFAPVKKSGVQLAREANYAHNLVPTHNFSEPQKLSIQDLQGGVLVGVPGDRSLTGHSLMSVNGVPLSKAVELHGGPRYGQRKSDLGEDAFWASQSGAASALQNKATNAAERARGNPVFGMYTAMAPDASNYALHHTEALVNQLDALNPNKAKLRAFDAMIKEQHPDFVGMNHPEVMNQFSANSELRKYVADRLNKSKIAAEYGMPSGEATIHAITDPALRNVSTGSTGFSVGEMRPGANLRPELEHPTYDTQIPGQFKGQMIAQLPWEYYFPEAAKKIAANPNQAPYAWGTFKMGDYHQPVTQELVDKIAPIEEMVKSATKDFKGYAIGGKVGAIKKLAEDLQAAYKAKFTPDFLHGSPRNNITAFDTQAERNPNFLTALEEESNDLAPRGFISLTKKPKFANDYATGKNATVYPVSANLGKHFDPRLPENYNVFHQYWKGNPESFPNYYGSPASLPKSFREAEWSVMEDPGFLEHLKSKGYNSMTMVENGQPNVGIFDPKHIRGKFAKFNPENAESPDFMKAAGGPVEHYAPGGKVLSSGLESLLGMIKAEGRTPVVPVPNRWFAQPEKFPHVQGMVNKTLENSQLPREAFHSGAFIDPRTGQILDKNIYNDVGVLIDPNTGRPMMSAGKESGIEMLDPKTGSYTKSNLVRQSLFKPTGGDPMLGEMPFIATIEKGGMGHKYALGTEYATPTEMYNTMTGANPTLRPRSRGDVFGMGDVVGQVQIGGRGQPHDVYEKLFVAPKGSDVPGVKLSKKTGGKV